MPRISAKIKPWCKCVGLQKRSWYLRCWVRWGRNGGNLETGAGGGGGELQGKRSCGEKWWWCKREQACKLAFKDSGYRQAQIGHPLFIMRYFQESAPGEDRYFQNSADVPLKTSEAHGTQPRRIFRSGRFCTAKPLAVLKQLGPLIIWLSTLYLCNI